MKKLVYSTAAKHLVCADLQLLGYHAYLTDSSAHYDVVVDYHSKLIRVQVKSTIKSRILSASHRTKSYRFDVGKTRHNEKVYYEIDDFDVLALVALDIKRIAYINFDMSQRYITIRDPSANYLDTNSIPKKEFDDFPFETAVKSLVNGGN